MLRVSHTKQSCLFECPKKYDFKYNQGLEPIAVSIPLTIGKVVHEAFDMMYKGKDMPDILTMISKTFKDHASMVEVVDQEKFVVAKYTALGMFTFYPKDMGQFNSVSPELQFDAIPKGLRGVRLTGFIDRLLETTLSQWWIGEFKTTGLSHEQFAKHAKVSTQSTGYVYAMRSAGYNIEGVIFDVIKKPLLRKKEKETADDFGKRIYDDYGNPKRREFYYKRHYVYRTDEDIEIYEKDLAAFVKELRWRTKHNAFPRDTNSCYSWNRECEYMKICFCKKPDPLTKQLFFKERTKR